MIFQGGSGGAGGGGLSVLGSGAYYIDSSYDVLTFQKDVEVAFVQGQTDGLSENQLQSGNYSQTILKDTVSYVFYGASSQWGTILKQIEVTVSGDQIAFRGGQGVTINYLALG